MSRDVICLDRSPVDPYVCILDKGHDGPHLAHHNHPENHPGCVWGGDDGVRV